LGTHGSFLAKMLERVFRQKVRTLNPDGTEHESRPLERLTTREPDDPSIAMLDAWATAADVLTFYQERIANEGFLRTAGERRSVLEMARSIGYELSPGVAASTYLAFTVDESAKSPKVVEIPAGTQVASIPSKDGELPQVFETSDDFTAYADWNKMHPRTRLRQNLVLWEGREPADPPVSELYLVDTSGLVSIDDDTGDVLTKTELQQAANMYRVTEESFAESHDPNEGDRTAYLTPTKEVYLDGTDAGIEPGDRIMFVGRKYDTVDDYKAILRTVQAAEPDYENNVTCVTFTTGDASVTVSYSTSPTWSLSMVVPLNVSFGQSGLQNQVLSGTWTEASMQALMGVNLWAPVTTLYYITAMAIQQVVAPADAGPSDPGIFIFKQQVKFFGNTAPLWDVLPEKLRFGEVVETEVDNNGQPITEFIAGKYADANWDADPPPIDEDALGNDYFTNKGAHVFLERSVPEVIAGSWVVIEGADNAVGAFRVAGVREESLADFAISGKATGLLLHGDPVNYLGDDVLGDFSFRSATAYVESVRLTPAPWPYTLNPQEGDPEIMLDRQVLNIRKGQTVSLIGQLEGLPDVEERELLTVGDVIHIEGYTLLRFAEGETLKHSYERGTVTINANLVHATHGETVKEEVLGGGDGAQTNQKFKLKKPPLTYVSAATAEGSESSLSVFVDRTRWDEKPYLWGSSADDRTFVVRIDNEANACVVFGDGVRGQRLPTGQENIRATYRSGIGAGGEVAADSLTLLKKRPLGILEVNNPKDASGSEDPETLDKARQNAPVKVMTLDRIVSLRDFEDFARAFAGIGKAKASVRFDGDTEFAHLTIASSSGGVVYKEDDLFKNLKNAVEAARDPLKKVEIASFEPHYFSLKALVAIDPAYLWDDVKEEITNAILSEFSFEKRDFDQPVTAAEIIEVIHRTAAVQYVDLEQLYLYDETTTPPTDGEPEQILRPDTTTDWGDDQIAKAFLLTVFLAGITLEEIS